MKKLLVINIVIVLINVVISITVFIHYPGTSNVGTDTIVNKVLIDSIQTIINRKDSEVVTIKQKIEYEKSINDSLNGTDAVLLFESLVTE